MAYSRYAALTEDSKSKRKEAGQYVKQCRLDADMTQRELSQKLDLDYYTFISQVEGGSARVPPEKMVQWARLMGVVPAEFAKNLLKYYDPHMYDAMFAEKNLK